MHMLERLQELVDMFLLQYPNASIGLDRSSVFANDRLHESVDFINFVRTIQAKQPTYEVAYQYLVHRFVLRGSRAELLVALNRRMQASVAGYGALVLMEGISGIGKTSLALAQELHAQELGAGFVIGRCYDHGATPFWIWHDITRSIENLAGISIEILPAPFGKGVPVHSIQHLAHALSQWLIGCTIIQPLVILLDDLHWADSDSLEVLNQLAGTLGHQRILIIATYRSDETDRGHPLYQYLPLIRRNPTVHTLHLNPITKEDTAQLVTAYHGTCHPDLADYVYQRAAGHVLFTVELLHDLVDQNLLTQNADGLWLPPSHSLPVPTLLKQVILQRVARLGEIGETVLSHAAVVGETWQLELVEYLTELPEDELIHIVEQAVQAELIRLIDERQEICMSSA